MKKDKAVRKAEMKAALINGLKSLIGPVIILAIIVAVILVIVFYKEAEEEKEIVKVESYAGGEDTLVMENDRLLFEMDPTTTQFTVTDKESGMVWSSNPEGAEDDPIALKTEKNKLRSTVLLTYSTISGVDTLQNNFQYSMEEQIYDIEQGADYIKIHYSIGDVQKEYMIPPVMTEERMNSFLEKMNKEQLVMMTNYYKKYDINKLSKKDKEIKDELLERYPLFKDNVIYALRDTVNDSVSKKLQEYFEEIGYTYEEYLTDKANDTRGKVSNKPVFNMSVVYRLDGDDFVVEVPYNEIEYAKDYPVYYLSLLPYFGAGTAQENGFLFVPEGGGALIHFNNGKVKQNSYYANVYGWDMAIDRDAIVHETETYYNVFGLAKEGASYICIMEEGAPYAAIQADISGRSHTYNYVNSVYTIAHREQYDVSETTTGDMYVYEPQLPQDEKLVQRYCFLDSDSYVDMANEYHDYLTGKYGQYLTKNDDSEAPAAVEIVGAVDKVKQILGVPVSRPLELTTYKEAEVIITDLQGAGMKNMSVKMTGWMNGGVQQKMLDKVKLISDLGSKKDLKNLTATATNLGIPVYFNGITDYAMDSDLFDGFFVYTDAARFVSKEKAEMYQYSTTTYAKRDDLDVFYLLKAPIILQMAENLQKAATSYGGNVAFENIGDDLSADYYRKDPYSRQKVMLNQAELLKKMQDAGTEVMINAGNDYAIPYADMVTNMDLFGAEYTIIDKKIPFYQLALHGYVNYTGEPLNMTQDYEDELLKSAEYGAGLSFTFMDETAFTLQNTLYTQYFGSDYAASKDKMLEIYTRYNQELGHVFNQRMTGHEFVANGVTVTTYEDGTKVYVNYTYDDVKAKDGTLVTARDYVVVR
ncbi:MAG: hypothetical protein IJN16_03125 [Lachnospiraceae bacterium]|nr:hypothetical protein [Lachnospiraceae bacterium]